MGQYKLPFYLRVYLEAKKTYPRGLSLSLSVIYGLFVYLNLFQMYVSPDTSFLTSLARSLFLIVSLFAFAISIQCFFRKNMDYSYLLQAGVAVALLLFADLSASLVGFQVLFENAADTAGMFTNSVLMAFFIKIDRTMDIELLDQ